MQPSIPWSGSVSVFVIERTTIIHSLKCTVPFSLVVPLLSLAVTHCYLLSLVVIRCIIRYHLLHHSLSFVVILCHSLYHSLSFFITCCTTRCHSLSPVVPLVVTRSTTRLSFYKRSYRSVTFIFQCQWNFENGVSEVMFSKLKHTIKVL